MLPRAPESAPPSRDDVRQYRSGLKLLDDIRRPEEELNEWIRFVSLILYACKKAIVWKRSEAEAMQTDFNEFYSEIVSAKNGLTKLLKFSQRHKYRFDIIASFAEGKVGLTDKGGSNSMLTRRLLHVFFDELNRPRMEIRDQFLEKWNGEAGLRMLRLAGPLCFPGIIADRKRPDVKLTGLQFELSFLLRRYTACLTTRPLIKGDEVPSEGRPCHAIVAEFIRCSLMPEFSDDKGQAFLKVLRENRDPEGKGIVWSGWCVAGMAEAPGGKINLFGA